VTCGIEVIDIRVSSCDAKVGLGANAVFGFRNERSIRFIGAGLRASQR
jgi:hypothetical protein